jgi:hypothetical protein
MKCGCGAGYCPVDNVTYPCVCELLVDFKLDPLDPEFEISDSDEEEDDLPF